MKASEIEQAVTLAYLDTAAVWQTITGVAVSISSVRGGKPAGVTDDLDTGTLSAKIVSADLDPATSAALGRGVKAYLAANLDGAGDVRLFTGVIDTADVDYPDRKFDPAALPQITVTIVDAQQQLANTPAPYGYAGPLADKIATIVQPTGLAWTVDGIDSAGNAGAAVLSVDDSAKAWDQLLLARNSECANLWIDRNGNVCAADPGYQPPGPNLLQDGSFEAGTGGFAPFGTDPTVTTDTTHVRTGAQSLKVSTTISGGGPEANQSLAVDLEPGDVIEFTGWSWVDSSSTLIRAVTGSGDALNSNYNTAHDGAFHPMTVRLPVTKAAGSLGLFLYSQSDTTPAWFDDLELHVIKPAGRLDANDPAASFTDLKVGYSTRALVNVLTVSKNNLEAAGATTYGPYVNQASKDAYGTLSASVEVMDGTPSEIAHTYLARTGTPAVVPSSVTLDPANNAYAVAAELYDRVTIANFAGIDPAVLWVVVGIEHSLESGRGWLTTLTLRAPVAEDPAVVITEPATGSDTGPIDGLPAPVRPGEPAVTTKLGTVVIGWDGLATDGSTANYDAEVWRNNPTPATLVGVIPRGGGTVVDAGLDYGTEYTYQIRGVNRYGVASDWSDPQFVTPVGVTDPDIPAPISKITIADDMITAPMIAANAVKTRNIEAGSVEADKLAANSVTVGAIAAGAVTAEKLEATAIDGMTVTGLGMNAVDHLAVGDRTGYDDAGTGWWFSGSGYANVKDPSGANFLIINPKDAVPYFQLGSGTQTLRYEPVSGELTLRGSFATDGDDSPRIALANQAWGGNVQGPAISFLVIDSGDGANNHGPHIWSNNSASLDVGGAILPPLAPGAALIGIPATDLAVDPNNVGYVTQFSVAPRSAMLRTRNSGSAGDAVSVATTLELYDQILLQSYVDTVHIAGRDDLRLDMASDSAGGAWLELNHGSSGSNWDLSTTDGGGNWYKRFWSDGTGVHLQDWDGTGHLGTWLDLMDGGHIEFGNNANWGSTPTNSKIIFVGGLPGKSSAAFQAETGSWPVLIGQSGQLYGNY